MAILKKKKSLKNTKSQKDVLSGVNGLDASQLESDVKKGAKEKKNEKDEPATENVKVTAETKSWLESFAAAGVAKNQKTAVALAVKSLKDGLPKDKQKLAEGFYQAFLAKHKK